MKLEKNTAAKYELLEKQKEDAIRMLEKPNPNCYYPKTIVTTFIGNPCCVEPRKETYPHNTFYGCDVTVPLDVCTQVILEFKDNGYFVWEWVSYTGDVLYIVTNRKMCPEKKFTEV